MSRVPEHGRCRGHRQRAQVPSQHVRSAGRSGPPRVSNGDRRRGGDAVRFRGGRGEVDPRALRNGRRRRVGGARGTRRRGHRAPDGLRRSPLSADRPRKRRAVRRPSRARRSPLPRLAEVAHVGRGAMGGRPNGGDRASGYADRPRDPRGGAPHEGEGDEEGDSNSCARKRISEGARRHGQGGALAPGRTRRDGAT